MLPLPHFATIADYLASVGVVLPLREAKMVVLDLAELPPQTALSLAPCRRGFYQINVLLYADSGSYQISTDTYRHKSGTAYFISPDHIYAWERNKSMQGFLIYFQPEVLGKEANRILAELEPLFGVSRNNYCSLPDQAISLLKPQLQLLRRHLEYGSGTKVLRYALLQLLHHLLAAGSKFDPGKNVDRSGLLVGQYQNIVNKHFRRNHQVATYANWVGVSPNYLNLLCREKLNRTAKQIIENRILLEAKCLLRATNNDVSEIAAWLGFKAATHFSRFFRKHVGRSPSQYRSDGKR